MLSILVSHVHDGADLRMRSYTSTLDRYDSSSRRAQKLSRQKHSKIQNHTIEIHGLESEPLSWICAENLAARQPQCVQNDERRVRRKLWVLDKVGDDL